MSYILCDMDCDQEINKSDIEEHCSDCLCVGESAGRGQQDVSATKAWRSTSVVKGRGHPKTLSKMNSSDDDFVMEAIGNDSAKSYFGITITRKKPKKAIKNSEQHPSKHIKHQNMELWA